VCHEGELADEVAASSNGDRLTVTRDRHFAVDEHEQLAVHGSLPHQDPPRRQPKLVGHRRDGLAPPASIR
jgi:hypothetical protein